MIVDMFVNRIILFDDRCDIYFNVSDDKQTQLVILPDSEPEIYNKKEQSNHKGSDCSLLAGLTPTLAS